MVPVARRNLMAEKGRLAISVAGVAFAVLLTLLVLSLYRGWSNIGKLITKLPGDVWIVAGGDDRPVQLQLVPERRRGATRWPRCRACRS